MRVRLTDAAEDDLAAIHDYYTARSETAARRVVSAIAKGTRTLRRFPKIGKPGHYPDTREHFTARYGYRIVYAIDEDEGTVYVLRIMHPAQEWPPSDG